MGAYFFDLIEFFLDLMMLIAQMSMSAGIYVLGLIDSLLPSNVDWVFFWSQWPVETMALARYVGLFECFFILLSATVFRFFWKMVF